MFAVTYSSEPIIDEDVSVLTEVRLSVLILACHMGQLREEKLANL